MGGWKGLITFDLRADTAVQAIKLYPIKSSHKFDRTIDYSSYFFALVYMYY